MFNRYSGNSSESQRKGTIFQCFLSYTIYHRSPTHQLSVTLFLAIRERSSMFWYIPQQIPRQQDRMNSCFHGRVERWDSQQCLFLLLEEFKFLLQVQNGAEELRVGL